MSQHKINEASLGPPKARQDKGWGVRGGGSVECECRAVQKDCWRRYAAAALFKGGWHFGIERGTRNGTEGFPSHRAVTRVECRLANTGKP